MTPEYGRRYVVTSPGGRSHRVLCLDVLRPGMLRRAIAGEPVAAIAADPPYCSGTSLTAKRSSGRRIRTPYTVYEGDSRSNEDFVWWARTWLLEALEVSQPETYCFLWTDWSQVGNAAHAMGIAGWLRRGMATWDKTGAARQPHLGYIRHQAEFCHWGTAGPLRPDLRKGGRAVPGVFTCKVDAAKIHRHQKPVEVWEWLLAVLADRPGIVVDPFGGSLSALLAAERLGRSSVTFERSSEILVSSFERLEKLGFKIGPATWHEDLLWRVASGEPIAVAARLLGKTRQAVYSRAANDNDFGARFQAAKLEGAQHG